MLALLIISQWFLMLGITPSDVWFLSTTHSTIQRIGGIPLFKNKIVLDAGGLKKLIFCIKYGAKKVIILDYDKRTVAAARKNLSKFRNAQVLYKDIYKIAKDIHFKEII